LASTKWKEYECTLEWAKVFEDNRDMGGDQNDAAKTVASHDGVYSVDMIVTDEVKAQMIKDGIPEISMGYEMFKDEGGGMWRYKAKRRHAPAGQKNANGEQVILGPPNVIDLKKSLEADEVVNWDSAQKLGNGTGAHVKLRIYQNGQRRSITLGSIGVTDLVEYEPEGLFW